MAYLLRCDTVSEAWPIALDYIEREGSDVITEDGYLTREVLDFIISIKNPLEGWPFPGSWNLPKLDQYAEQLTTFSYDCKGFDYMYNERMGRQKFYVVKELRAHPTTRRATMYLWLPEKDLETGLHKPCQIVADYKIRDTLLTARHFFRSHDYLDALPQNLYGLAKLQKQIADEVGVTPSSLTIISASAHIYKR